MALSVIVTSYESPETLERCLQSISEQPQATQILVSDCSRVNPAGFLSIRFPSVRFQHFDTPQSVPMLRWGAMGEVRGEVVAFAEARCVPSSSWCKELLEAHQKNPECPAVGGSVALYEPAELFAQAIYLCEYSAFAPPVMSGPTQFISGANFSYKRSAIEDAASFQGEWETVLHQQWIRQGKKMWQSEACVSFENSMSIQQGIRQRWHYGRGYAADRVREASAARRLVFAVISLALPALLLARMARDCSRKGLLPIFFRSFAWTVILTIAWSWGETTGYLFGKSSAQRIF